MTGAVVVCIYLFLTVLWVFARLFVLIGIEAAPIIKLEGFSARHLLRPVFRSNQANRPRNTHRRQCYLRGSVAVDHLWISAALMNCLCGVFACVYNETLTVFNGTCLRYLLVILSTNGWFGQSLDTIIETNMM